MERLTVSLSPHIRGEATTQRIMLDVLIALLPAGIASVIFFGWRALLLIVLAVGSALACEALMQKIFKRDVTITDGSAAITGLLIAYNLPSGAPWWIAILGSAFAVILVKQLFGGLGHNFLNPAMTARAFLLASFPALMTSFALPMQPDVLSTATPLVGIYQGIAESTPSLADLFLGNVPGSLGEVSALALILGGLYLIIRRVIDWRIPLCFFATMALISLLAGVDPLMTLLSGGAMLGGFFMLTDYVTSPMTKWGRVIFAVGAGALVMCIRLVSKSYPEGMTYAILLMNLVTPLINRFTRPRKYGEVKRNA